MVRGMGAVPFGIRGPNCSVADHLFDGRQIRGSFERIARGSAVASSDASRHIPHRDDAALQPEPRDSLDGCGGHFSIGNRYDSSLDGRRSLLARLLTMICEKN